MVFRNICIFIFLVFYQINITFVAIMDLMDLEKRFLSLEQRVQTMGSLTASSAGLVFTSKDVASLFEVTEQTLYSWRKSGAIGFSKIGKQVYFSPDDIREFLKQFHS